ncbi:MAG TPA: hypothetical protein VFV50_03110 [Bdellovibrionales bacterium]|nr:hypothetical protein [Bdellovibrionales bacterium]
MSAMEKSTGQDRPAQANQPYTEIRDRLFEAAEKIRAAARSVDRDNHSSYALTAVVRELESKLDKIIAALDESDDVAVQQRLTELEQAADSAKKAASFDHDAAYETRQAVIQAHDALNWIERQGDTRH